MDRRKLLLGTAGLFAAPGVLAESVEAKKKLYLQPLGKNLSKRDTDYIEKTLKAFFAVRVARLDPVPYPKEAWYPSRKRWRAEVLLDWLDEHRRPDVWKTVAICKDDISTTKEPYPDWGIMGLGTIGGPSCVISRFRCKKRSRGPRHTRIRLGKVVVHEVGHTLGLDHCPVKGCLLQDAGGKVSTIDGERDFCATTRQQIAKLGHPLVPFPDIPWGS